MRRPGLYPGIVKIFPGGRSHLTVGSLICHSTKQRWAVAILGGMVRMVRVVIKKVVNVDLSLRIMAIIFPPCTFLPKIIFSDNFGWIASN